MKRAIELTIPAGESLSSVGDLATVGDDARVALIVAPTEWNDCNVNFLVSTDGVTFADLYDERRKLNAGTAVPVDPDLTIAVSYLRLKTSRPQADERVVTAVVVERTPLIRA